eukprot:gnl/TRDRNA2_/TRDRNA2_28471_c0_seq1.p1 gnl/TRDRNA2_/TRDRNA2_28471_c0~~gnl/TRDRNA2_/TRDRNA2_28471_c0_seq1.p1  ORF type:complete len:492 (+),score=55.18 gnl/TRDRNA2_/TRDRNA2_28471_c0_seq1:119-1594(+)
MVLSEPSEAELKAWHALPLGTAIEGLPRAATGPLALRQVEGRGRGLFVTEAVERGRLLLISRALAMGERGEGLCYAVTEAYLKASVADQCRFEALTGSGCAAASSFSCIGSEAACSLSWWTADSTTALPEGLESLGPEGIVEVVQLNSMAITAMDECSGTRAGSLSGVFLLASLLNHDCVPSATRHFLGDAILVRASRQLVPGDEVTTAYAPSFDSLEKRRACLRGYGFECRCVRCRLEELVPCQSCASDIKDVASILRLARQNELACVAAATASLLQEAFSAGICLRGLFLASSYHTLTGQAARLDVASPEALQATELLEEAAAAVLPCSPLHCFWCSARLTALAAGAGGGASLAVAAASARGSAVHEACYGGGKRLWCHRLKGHPAAALTGLAAQAPGDPGGTIAPSRVHYPLDGQQTIVDVSVLAAATAMDLDVDISDLELRISLQGRVVSNVHLDATRFDASLATVQFDVRRRRLRIAVPCHACVRR